MVERVRLSFEAAKAVNLQMYGCLSQYWKRSYHQVPTVQASGEHDVGSLCRKSMIFRIVYCHSTCGD